MGFADQYLSRHGEYDKLISDKPCDNLKIIAIIPAYNESGLQKSLDFLFKTKTIQACIEIIVLINYPHFADDKEKEINQNIYAEVSKWASIHSQNNKRFYILLQEITDPKNTGVGLSRKILMDEAVRRFNQIENRDGIICSMDADTLGEKNYFEAIQEHFTQHPKTDACSIYFEHPVSGNEFSSEVYEAICYYELHLRYYLQSLRLAGHPNSYYTVGSSFAVKADAYCLQGGMNKRKAGEDFYFLQKFFDIGRFTECKSTSLYPSPRPSNRVPFGTGRAINDLLKSGKELLTFSPELFNIIKGFITTIKDLQNLEEASKIETSNLHETLQEFLEKNQFPDILDEIIRNSSDINTFKKRFFRWFNMFKILKFLNYGKTRIPDIRITVASNILLKHMGIEEEEDAFELLNIYRNLYRLVD